MINNVETSRRNSYTCLHPFTYWRQMRKSHSDAIEIALKKLVSLASIRLRGTEMAANRKRHSYCDVTTIRQTRHFRFWRRQISRWRRRWFRQTEGDRFLPSTSFFQCMHPVRGDVVIMCTHRITVLFLYSGLCDIRVLFYVRCRFTCVAYSNRLDSTMSDSVHRFLYQVYQVCCGVRVY